ncbi:hypothetical protein ACTACG_07130 [Pseudomonas syringae]|uniref:hypothetical protein n=1 Tax=Pseudomonas syringae TaxID=317 RepID=UPI003F751D1C
MTNNPSDVRVSRELLNTACNGHVQEQAHALNQLRALLAQPADQQGEPVMRLEAEKLWVGDGEYTVDFVKPGWLKECREKGGTFLLYASAQPATAKVVLPERLDLPHRDEFESADQHAAAVGEAKTWNACLDEVAKLNTPQ